MNEELFETPKQLRERAAATSNAINALELRVRALELESAARAGNTRARPARAKKASAKAAQ